MTGLHRAAASLLILLLFCVPAHSAELGASAHVGAVGGVGGDLFLEVADFAEGLPLNLRLGLEYQGRDAGDPMAARRIFINDNTNGTPDSSARAWGARLDLMWPLDMLPVSNLLLYGGPRYASFTGTFDYIGGNENFDVVSSHWGWGMGVEGRYPMGPTTSFVLGGGFDWYLGSELDGHDTIYSPDLDPVNGRADYTYDDADEAIGQPGLEWRLVLGLQMTLAR